MGRGEMAKKARNKADSDVRTVGVHPDPSRGKNDSRPTNLHATIGPP